MRRIGLDESGKGDYFGPLVVAAVCADEDIEGQLREMGVKDSKRLSDKRILELSVEIKRLCPNSVIMIGPKKYNQLYQRFCNLNRLLAWAHARALENVLEAVQCELAIADQFGDESFLLNALMEKGRRVRLEQRHRAEEETVVAAASILARAGFVEKMRELSDLAGIELPKGASNPSIVSVGKELFEKGGLSVLEEVAKLHFRITDIIKSSAS